MGDLDLAYQRRLANFMVSKDETAGFVATMKTDDQTSVIHMKRRFRE